MLFQKVLKQSLIPSFISLFGLMFSAAILSKLELSEIELGLPFRVLEQLTILVPVLNNLNGNFELNLSCRLGTCANSGEMKFSKSRLVIFKGNLIFMLLQSIVLGIFCGSFAIVISGVVGILTSVRQYMVLTLSTILTVLCGSLVLGTFMNSLIVMCVYFNIDPDNIAAPIACALGDATTLIFFTLLTNVCMKDTSGILCFITICALLALAYRLFLESDNIESEYLHPRSMWSYIPYLLGVCITTFSGLALDEGLDKYKGLASLAPVINGLSGGNTSIYASRLTTSYSLNRKENNTQIISAVWLLTLLNVLTLLILAKLLKITDITTRLVIGSLITFNICLFILVKAVKPFCEFLNKQKIDLDAVVLPLITALGDLGTIIYILVFLGLDAIKSYF
eukprot:NODE_22_length_42145_cov_1.310612.p9 type:complete len:395 gc:universal NODE_22_length_42145_cov_1.310612:35865-34681(-)